MSSVGNNCGPSPRENDMFQEDGRLRVCPGERWLPEIFSRHPTNITTSTMTSYNATGSASRRSPVPIITSPITTSLVPIIRFRFGIDIRDEIEQDLLDLLEEKKDFNQLVEKYDGYDLLPFLCYSIIFDDSDKAKKVLSKKPSGLTKSILGAVAQILPEDEMIELLLDKFSESQSEDKEVLRKL